MPRVKSTVQSRRRRKKILKAARGYRGGRSKLLKTAKESVMGQCSMLIETAEPGKEISGGCGLFVLMLR